MKKIVIRMKITAATLLFLCSFPVVSPAAVMNDYCITPSFLTESITPNLLLMIDNSASMYDLAWTDRSNMYCANSPTTSCAAGTTCGGTAYCVSSGTTTTSTTHSAKPCTSNAQCPNSSGSKACDDGFCKTCNTNTGVGDCVSTTTDTFTPTACATDGTCSAITAGDTCNNKCNITHQCYDTTYSSAQVYEGYFDTAATYTYDFASSSFTSGATMPDAGCAYSAGTPRYFCVKTTDVAGKIIASTGSDSFYAKGNFLNWLSASKFDIEKKILTGGKTEGGLLIGETRGCGGRKFIKAVPDVDLTFSVRGGTELGVGITTNQASEYGQTYIELYTFEYNAEDCLKAANDWMNITSTNPPKLGAFQNDTKGCVSAVGDVGVNTSVTATSFWNHILHDCYQGLTNGAQGYETNLGPLEDQCEAIYAYVAPADMESISDGYAVCSSAITYVDLQGTAKTGYLGSCWNGATFDRSCTLVRMKDFCEVNVSVNPVVDPSSTAIGTTGQSVPGFILAQGLPTPSATLKVRLSPPATAKTPLIDKYKDRLRFGFMTFQNNGSGAECGSLSIPCAKTCSVTRTRICYKDTDCPVTNDTQETCNALPKADGGVMGTYVGSGFCSATTDHACVVNSDCAGLSPSSQTCVPSIGDHTSGLIHDIDMIPATSWTPFAEAFYNAIGFFARSNAYSLSPPSSRSDGNLSSLAAPNTAISYVTTKNPSQYICQQNNILLITDGMSTADRNSTSEDFAALYASQVPNAISGYDAANNCPKYSGSRSVSTLAWVAKNRNIKTLATTGTASNVQPTKASESITTYVVYSGDQTSGQPGLCDPYTLMGRTAAYGGTELLSAQNYSQLYDKLDEAFEKAAGGASSGTAASILSNSEGSGANILQAVFYPKKEFDKPEGSDENSSAQWIGEMQNLWYYIDPFVGNSSVREDTGYESGDHFLDLKSDYVVQFYFDTDANSSTVNQTMVKRYRDSDGNGTGDTLIDTITPDAVKSLWKAGNLLWQKSAGDRTLYTNVGTTSSGGVPVDFSTTGLDTSLASIRQKLNASAQPEANNIINYTRGVDLGSGFRSRTVTIGASSGVWKLGDIISSTPRLQSSVRQNSYNLPSPSGYTDQSYGDDSIKKGYIHTTSYKNRGMVYVGANDGMLHAFKLGTLDVVPSGDRKAKLSGTDLGEELWAFIPQNALPYLKYSYDPDYSHLYFIDGNTSVIDASIGKPAGCASDYWDCLKDFPSNSSFGGSNWRTVLVSGMGIGGAAKNSDASCTADLNGDGEVDNKDCVKTPVSGVGFSSYFALDVTNPNDPRFLWEFSDASIADAANKGLAYATSGAAIVKVSAQTAGAADKKKNGRWFAVIGSGPTGPIDTAKHRFLATSDQNLKLYVIDLTNGSLLAVIDKLADGSAIPNAFVSSLSNATIDTDRWNASSLGNYQDDALYFGYVQANTDEITTATTWTKGGVLRLVTGENLDPTQWKLSKVIDNIGPVTTGIARLQDRKTHKLWLYFGTGRYFYQQDDQAGARALYAIQEPCYKAATDTIDKTCTDASGALTNQTAADHAAAPNGWFITLDAADAASGLGAERVITDPVAMTNGAVFFTTFKPTTDPCGFGGNTYLWATRYDTGLQAPCSALESKALLQVSTGSFEELDLSTAFDATCPPPKVTPSPPTPPPPGKTPVPHGDAGYKHGRRTAAPMVGKPPGDPPPIVSKSNLKPVKRIIHIQER